MPSLAAVLGFLFGVTVLVMGATGLIPGVIGGALTALIFGGWIFFSIREPRRSST